jgi:hypothetical protein
LAIPIWFKQQKRFLGSTHEATQLANQDALERTIRFIDATIGTPCP